MKISALALSLLSLLTPDLKALTDSTSPTLPNLACCNDESASCRLAEVDLPPTPVSEVCPAYPAELKAAKIGGHAVVALVVDATGVAREVRWINQTSEGFGDSAVAALQQWRFNPAMKDGRSVACRLQIPIVFSLPQ